MRRLLFWIQENWEATLALFLLAAVLIYESVHLLSKTIPPAAAEVTSYIIMLMLGSLTIMLLRMRSRAESDNADQLTNRLIVEHAGGNPFIESLVRSKLEFLKDLRRETFGTTSVGVGQLIDAVRFTERGDDIQSIDYGPGWKPDFVQLQRENLEASKRGVRISRVFIIPEKIASDRDRAVSLWETMVEQALGGISVRWVAQSDLKTFFLDLANDTRGMALFRYGSRDCSLLMLDDPDAHVILLAGAKPGFTLYWNKHHELRKRENDFRELESLSILKELRDTVSPSSEPPFFSQGKPRFHAAAPSDH